MTQIDEKSQAIRQVLEQRIAVARRIMDTTSGSIKAYWEGLKNAYLQAYELLGEDIESIKIELEK